MSESFDLLQIRQAAIGCVSGTLEEWPQLRRALSNHGVFLPKTANAMEVKAACINYFEQQGIKISQLLRWSNMNNLPPGVTAGMLPGNRPEDEAWEKFYEWAIEQLMTLDLDDARRAVKVGIAGVQAEQQEISRMLHEARKDERMSIQFERASGVSDELLP